jgi:hypothetical protein
MAGTVLILLEEGSVLLSASWYLLAETSEGDVVLWKQAN